MSDEQLIRDLIRRWAQGVRGLDAYRETWPGFFDWQASGRCSNSSPPE